MLAVTSSSDLGCPGGRYISCHERFASIICDRDDERRMANAMVVTADDGGMIIGSCMAMTVKASFEFSTAFFRSFGGFGRAQEDPFGGGEVETSVGHCCCFIVELFLEFGFGLLRFRKSEFEIGTRLKSEFFRNLRNK